MIEVVFYMAIFLIAYTYLLYPLLLLLLYKIKQTKTFDLIADDHPSVAIVISARNEEHIITEKIHSIFNTHYPIDKIEILICSDASTDSTLTLLESMRDIYPQIRIYANEQQSGKSYSLNKLISEAQSEIVLFTDANIIFYPDTIGENVKYYQDNETGLVGSWVENVKVSESGISFPESVYILRENTIKYLEGKLWRTTIAPFGACFSIRKELFKIIPGHFLVDDFYTASQVLAQNYKCVYAKESRCKEEIKDSLQWEFRRKKRIGAGNFQNLGCFLKLYTRIDLNSFCFWSHKGLRWLVPFLLLLLFISNILLLKDHLFYQISFMIQLFFYCIALTDYKLNRIRQPIKLIKFVSYFLIMNAALLAGFIQAVKGVKAGYWDHN